MRISVVIPALDEVGRVGTAIRSARAPGADVIVVDGGSVDGTVDAAKAAGARVIQAERGRARQLETGLRAATGDAVILLHADSRLPAGFEPAVCEALADPAVVGGAFAFRFDRRDVRLQAVEWGARLRNRLFALPYGDQAIFARRDALLAIGGIPQAPIMEDLDLVRSLKRRGRLAHIALPTVTSARRYLERGVLRTALRNQLALLAWAAGIDRARVARWYRA